MFIGHITKIKQNVKAYISSNLSVIPLQANSKQPAVNWKEFQTRKISAQEIDKYEWHNVGIVTGTISSLVVFDADTEAAVSFLRNFEEFRNTATVKTRRGIHYYFIVDDLPQEFGSQKIYKDNIKIDLKANGGYVVAPPSVVDGHEYVWGRENGDGSAQEVLELSFSELQGLIEEIKSKLSIDEKAEQKEEMSNLVETVNIKRLKRVILQKYEEGRRQDIVMYLSGWLRKEGIPRETVEQIVVDLCFKAGDRDVKQRLSAVDQAWKKETDELKGISGLIELGYQEQDLKRCLGIDGEKSKSKPSENNFFTDGKFVYFVKGTRREPVPERIGPWFTLKTRIFHEDEITYEIEYNGKRKFMKEIKDLEAIRRLTGIAVLNERRFLEWLSLEAIKEIPEKHIRTQTGWQDGVFYHPAIQTEDIWEKWHWHKKIKQYQNKPEKQHELIREALADGRHLATVYAFCLASVLNEVLNVNPGVLFISGPAHVGKTTLAQLGINLFLPAEEVFTTTNATPVGLELLMKGLKDLPLLIDECVLKDWDLEKIVFMIASKTGKVRGTKSLSINISDIASNAIFTSEVLEQNTFKRAGAQRRFLGITIEDFSQDCFSKTTIEEIQKAKKYYGAGVDIIRFIQKNMEKMQGIKEQTEKEVEMFGLQSIHNIALSLLAAIRVFEMFYNEEYRDAYRCVLLALDAQKREFEQKINFVERFKDEFSQFIVQKDNQILDPSNENKKILGEIIGQREGGNIYILAKVFRDFCQEHGFEMKTLIKELIRNEMLIPYSHSHPRTMKRIAGTVVATYKIKLTE